MKTLILIVGLLVSSYPLAQASPMGEQAKNEVFANALLEDQPRIEKANEILGYRISSEQESALLRAHNLTADEVGTDNTPVRIFPDGTSNFTRSQLRRKARVLVSGGFKLKEVDLLMRAGLAGEPCAGDPDPWWQRSQPVLPPYDREEEESRRLNGPGSLIGANERHWRRYQNIELEKWRALQERRAPYTFRGAY
jgi:hypothetical protein